MKVKTMLGKTLDMGLLISKNQKAVALGNANMNARGDVIDTRGRILKSREEVAQAYYASNPNAVKQVALRDISNQVFSTPAEALSALKPKAVQEDVTASDLMPEPEPAPVTPPTPVRKRKIEDTEF